MGIIRRLLGSTVVGIYLFGSSVVGGLRPGSDLDILAVVKERPSEKTRRDLVEGLMKVSGRGAEDGPARPVELTVVNLSDVVPWRYPPRGEFVYGEWLRAEFEEGRVPRAGPDPDLAVVLAMARADSVALLGPDARDLLEPVPAEDLRRAIAESLPDLIDTLRGDERNVLLTLARMWMTRATGEIVPKDVAAGWALARLPHEHRAILEMARRAYLGECDDEWRSREREVNSLVRYLKLEIAGDDG